MNQLPKRRVELNNRIREEKEVNSPLRKKDLSLMRFGKFSQSAISELERLLNVNLTQKVNIFIAKRLIWEKVSQD